MRAESGTRQCNTSSCCNNTKTLDIIEATINNNTHISHCGTDNNSHVICTDQIRNTLSWNSNTQRSNVLQVRGHPESKHETTSDSHSSTDVTTKDNFLALGLSIISEYFGHFSITSNGVSKSQHQTKTHELTNENLNITYSLNSHFNNTHGNYNDEIHTATLYNKNNNNTLHTTEKNTLRSSTNTSSNNAQTIPPRHKSNFSCKDRRNTFIKSQTSSTVSLPQASPTPPASSCFSKRKLHNFLFVLFLLALVSPFSDACAPRGGSGRRRRPRKLTPLVYKQHVPDVSENTIGASGLADGPIKRGDEGFKDLVRNNPEIIFRDEEGTGADRIMSQRCKDKLNTLAVAVQNHWPGISLRVTEAWDEDGTHASNSLHYEGRAVDITTSDKDRSKYGMLARLAVEAGFDWVYYETRAHVHCSVQSDSSMAITFGGCFFGDSLVVTPNGGTKLMSEVRVGDRLLSTDPVSGQPMFSDVIAFLDHSNDQEAIFYTVKTASGRSVTLTGKHLAYFLSTKDVEEDEMFDNKTNGVSSPIKIFDFYGNEVFIDPSAGNSSPTNGRARASPPKAFFGRVAFAEELRVGQYLIEVQGASQGYLPSATVEEPGITSPSSTSLDETATKETLTKPRQNQSGFLKSTSDKNHEMSLDKIISIEITNQKGVFAPLTAHGTLIVDGYVMSCYAFLKDVKLAHSVFAPVRAYHTMKSLFITSLNSITDSVNELLFNYHPYSFTSTKEKLSDAYLNSTALLPNSTSEYSHQEGPHWYARALYSIAVNVLDMDIFISM